ncbi:MAG: tyrosine-protein phosphatase [Victivallaceae bacterium]|nr:tyrosine-protein phosphatase [Victivallaceae bacterium]
MKNLFTLFLSLFILTLAGAETPRYLLFDGKQGVFVETPQKAEKSAICLVSPQKGETLPLLTLQHKEYLALPDETRREKFSGELKKAKKLPESCNQVKLVWKNPASPVTVTVSESPDLTSAVSVTTTRKEITLGNLKIATRYYWKVSDANGSSETAFFDTENVAPRVLSVKGTWNVRDLGGRIGLNGRRVRQGMLYRSAGLNENSSGGKAGRGRLDPATRNYVSECLGWKTDLDLRNEKECAKMTRSPAGENVGWVHIPSSMYGYIVDKNFGRDAFKKELLLLLDEKNYPLVFHCINGKDRTGTLAYILLALLGVGEKELLLDWEFTRLCKPSAGLEYAWIDEMRRNFARYAPGESIHVQVEKWVLSLGITQDEIARFRNIMLE